MKRIAMVLALVLSMFPIVHSSAASLSAVSLNPTSVAGGVKSTATIKLASLAPTGGHSIALSSSNTAAATVPASVTVKAGTNSATFTVTTFPTTENKTTTIYAVLGSVTKSAKLTVTPAKLSSLSIAPTSIINNRTAIGTLTISGPAPTGGVAIALSSDNDAATVPATATVPAGKTTVTFSIQAKNPDASTAVNIAAALSGVTKTVKITVMPLVITKMTQTGSIVGGSPVTGTITLNGTAPTGGAVVSLSSDSASGTVPATITIKAGATSANFTMLTKQVTTATKVTVTATYNGSTKTAATNVAVITVTSFTLTPTQLTGGNSTAAKISISGPAPAGGAVIALSSPNPDALKLPATVSVAAGGTSVSFNLGTNNVTETLATSVTVSYLGSSKTVNLTLVPVAVASVSLSPSSTVGGQSAVTGFVKLTGPAPTGGAVVTLTSNNENVIPYTQTTVPAGETMASFGMTTVTIDAALTAVITGTYAGTSKSSSLTVNPLAVSTLTYPTVVTGGNSTKIKVTLNGVAPVGGAVVTLTSSNPSVINLPATVTVPANKNFVEFSITPAVVSADTNVTVTAKINNLSKSGTISVKKAALYSIGLNAAITIGGLKAVGTVLLTGPAPEGGIVVTLSSNNAAGQVPVSVTVPAGKKEVDFQITTTPTLTAKTVTITGKSGSVTTTTKLTVNPPGLRDILPSPISVVSGGSTTTTLRLTGPAPAGGMVIALSSSLIAYATVPASVTVPEGARSVQFLVSATDGAPIGQTLSLTASALGKSKSALVQITAVQMTAFTVTPTSVVGGATVTGKITISGAAPVNGASIALETVDSSVEVPDTVTVIKNTTSVSFSIATLNVTTAKIVTIYATFNSSTITVDLQLLPLKPSSLIIVPDEIEGTQSATATLTMNGIVPSGSAAVSVALSSSNAYATVPSTVSVAGGSSSVTFPVTGVPVSVSRTSTISATYNGTTVTSVITIDPPTISSVTLDDVEVVGSLTRTGTVTLTTAAPTGGWQLSLGSTNVNATVPATVTVPAGSTTATFTVNTTAVANSVVTTITASRSSSLKQADLTILPPNLINFSLDKSVVLGGNANATGTVTIDVGAPVGGYSINLASNNTAIATVPSTVTIAAGQTSATFTVTSLLTNTTQTAKITASKGAASFDKDLQVLTLTVTNVSLTQSSVTGGTGTTATVTLNTGAPFGGATINLASNSGAAVVPTTLAFAAGATSQTFSITTNAVGSDTNASITGSYGLTSASATLTVLAPRPTSLTVSPTDVIGGVANATGTVTLNGPAPTGGAAVSLSLVGSGASVGSSVTVLAGQTSATFTITTSIVSSTQAITVSGAFAGTTKSGSFNVNPLVISSLTLSPVSVLGSNANSTATVTLNAAAPAGGVTVNLSSSITGSATVPGTMSIAAGQTSGTFTVTSKLVSANSNPVITASYNGSSQTATLQVTPLAVASVSLSPATVLGGSANSTATVTLNGVAPTGGAVITLASNATSAATVPGTVTVAQGSSSATFTVTSLVVSAATQAGISATYNGSSQSATLQVNSYSVSSVTLSPNSVVGNVANSTGTVIIGAAAPTGGLVVTLSSSNTAAATVPANVTIPEGQTQATFTVTSKSVTTVQTATITATSGSSAQATLTVNPITVSTVTLSPTSLVGGTGNVTGTVTLNAVAPAGGVVVSLSSSNSAAASVGASVTVAAGQTSNTFTITTYGVSSSNSVIISASYQGSKTATLTVNASSMNSLSISPSTVFGGVGNVTGTITLSQAAPTGGAVIALSSNNTNAMTVPASITIAAGQTTGTFTGTSLLVGSQTSVTLTATYNGTKTGTVTINPIVLNAVSVSPSTVYGGVANATGTVTINNAAPTGGIAVTLTSSNTNAATVPSSVTVAAGQTTATFTVTSKLVSSQASVTITGSLNGNQTANLTVNPIVINSVSISPSSVTGGVANATGTVTINNAAPTGGIAVALSSNNSAAAVPSSVTVAAGQTTATFTVTTGSVASSATATITATLNGTATSSLTLNPPTITGVSMSDSTVIGGTSNTVTVSISAAAPTGGLAISLSENSSSASSASSLTIAAGQTSGTATITTSAVSANVSVTVTATFNSNSSNTSFTILRPTLTGFTINPSQFKGGNSTTGTVTINGPAPTGGLVVSLSDNSSKLGTPSSVTITAGNTSANFTMTSSSVSSNTWVTVTASNNGTSLTYDIKLKN